MTATASGATALPDFLSVPFWGVTTLPYRPWRHGTRSTPETRRNAWVRKATFADLPPFHRPKDLPMPTPPATIALPRPLGTLTITRAADPETTPEGVEIVSRTVSPNGTVVEQLGDDRG